MHKAPSVTRRLPSLDVLAAKSQHAIHFFKGRAQCRNCASSLPLSASGVVRDWMATSCSPIPSSSTRPEPLPYCRIQLGRQIAHVSHDMYVYKRFYFCNKCGNRGVEKYHLFSSACQPRKVETGAATLAAIRADNMPPGIKVWPCDNCPRKGS